ncbi:hypothetical protein MASR1M29_20410 [Cloacibacterium normanense]
MQFQDYFPSFSEALATIYSKEESRILYRYFLEGLFFLEINQKLGKETLELFKNFSESELVKDLSGNDRIVMGRK